MSAHGEGSEDNGLGEKTEEATPRRQQQARERGEVPRSQEFSTAVTISTGLLLLATVGGAWTASYVTGVWHFSSRMILSPPGSVADASSFLRKVMGDIGLGLSLPMGVLVAVILLFNGLQARGTWAPKQLEWKFDKLNPIKGFQRLLKWTTLVDLLKAVLKFLVLSVALWLAVRTMWPKWMGLSATSVREIPGAMRAGTLRLMLFVVLLFGALAALDYAWQAFQYRRKLRMSLYEIKKELKEDQGDPTIRAWRRRYAMAQLRKIMLQSVRQADVVVTNPTHIAVALKVDEETETPLVLAMGTDRLAERLKKIARESGIPMVENRPLAKALLDTCRVGELVPPALYKAIGDVLAYVYRQTGRMPEWLKRRLKDTTTA